MAPSEPRRDPENTERRHLQRYLPQSGERVLDIGCGDGRLSWLFAAAAGLVVGLDIDWDELRHATRTRPTEVAPKVCFAAAEGEALPLVDGLFDLALFGWSL